MSTERGRMPAVTRAVQQHRTRTALIETAREHFAEHGYGAASLDKMAADAGYTRGAIYANFDGKSGLFLAVLDARLQTQISELEAIGTELDQLAEWRMNNAERQRGLAWAVTEFRLVALRDEHLRARLRERDRMLRRAFAGLVERACSSLGIALPIPAEQAAAALLALGDGLTQQHELDPDMVHQNTFEAVLAMLIRGVPPSRQ